MKGSDLKKMVQEAIKTSIKEMGDPFHNPSKRGELSPSDRDELAYTDHVHDLDSGMKDAMDDVDDLLVSVGNKLRTARDSGVDSEVIADAVQHIEEADRILSGTAMSEGIGSADRHVLVGQVQSLGKRIASRAAISSLSDGALSAMIANLTSIANKL